MASPITRWYRLIELAQISTLAPQLAMALIVMAALAFFWSLRLLRKSRTEAYWRKRRTAGQRGWHLLLFSLASLLVSALLCVIPSAAVLIMGTPTPTLPPTVVVQISSPTLPVVTEPLTLIPSTSSATTTPSITASSSATRAAIDPLSVGMSATPLTPSATFTRTATASPSATFTRTPRPSVTPTLTRTPVPTRTATATITLTSTRTATLTVTPTLTITATFTRTFTPTATSSITPTATITLTPTPTETPTPSPTTTETLVPLVALSTPVSNVTPSGDSQLTITALDTQLSAKLEPVAPSDRFAQGTTRLYFFVTYSAMQAGVRWRRELYYQGQLIQSVVSLWGYTAVEGQTFFFFGQPEGFPAGQYEIRLFIGDGSIPVETVAFTIEP